MECVIHLHISFMNLMILSIINSCLYFPNIYTIIGRSYYLNCDMLNLLSPLNMVTLKQCASYFYSTMSSTVFIWAVDLDLHGWAVRKFNFVDLVARKGYPFMKNKLMYNCKYLWCSDIVNGSGMRSISSDFGWYIVILPFNRGVAGT